MVTYGSLSQTKWERKYHLVRPDPQASVGIDTEAVIVPFYVELPSQRRFVLVVFTVGHSNERGIIHNVVREVVAALSSAPAELKADN